ncbi:MAG: hypothetical protein AVO33_09745 [delta proteobacterium ML8_F1]|nr:MAG: hypothetical protein AVO33_09745 [delta proteobacterium ML8_F1]
MKNAERIFILAIMIFSFAVIFEGSIIPVFSQHTIGPGFLPVVVGGALAVTCSALLIFSYIKQDTEQDKKKFISKEGQSRLLIFIVILMGALLLNGILGLIIPLTIFMILSYKMIENYTWWNSIKVAVVSNMIFYYIFKVWLGVPLPGINF